MKYAHHFQGPVFLSITIQINNINRIAMNKGRNRIQVWIKLQRKIKSVNSRIKEATCEKTRARLLRKLKILVNRLFSINRKWRVGIATAALLLWLGSNNIQAQNSIDLNGLDGTNGFKVNGVSGWDISNAGDFNGDDMQDVIISRKGIGAYVVFGANDGFPAELDVTQLDGTNGFALLDTVNTNCGTSVTGAGDFNGDNYDDLLIGQHNPAYHKDGNMFIVYGNNSTDAVFYLNDLDGTDGFRIAADSLNYIGMTSAGIADVNKDGFDDIAFTYSWSPYKEINEYSRVFLMYGTDQITDSLFNLDTLAAAGYGCSIYQYFNGFRGEFGGRNRDNALSFGDINGDGFDDLLIGEGRFDNMHVIFGSAQKLPEELHVNELTGLDGFNISCKNNDYVGVNLDVGDINGDGFDDIVAGNYWYYDNAYNSKAIVLFGKSDGFNATEDISSLDGTDGFEITGFEQVYDNYTQLDVAVVNDLNNDGFDDIVIGNYLTAGTPGLAGEVFVVFGSDDGWPANFDIKTLNDTTGFIIKGQELNDQLGVFVADIGDLNNDGAGDFAIDGRGTSPYIIFGKGAEAVIDPIAFNELDSTRAFTINDAKPWKFGDFNGDGKEDLLNNSSNKVLFGTNTPDSNTNFGSLDGTNGFQVTSDEDISQLALVDLNGDGFDELVIGQPNVTFTYDAEGQNVVLLGHDGGQNATVHLENLEDDQLKHIYTTEDDSYLGTKVYNAGDFDGDGFDDLLTVGENGSYLIFSDNNIPDSIDVNTELTSSQGFEIVAEANQFYHGNFNGDDKEDIVTLNWGDYEVLFGQEKGVINSVIDYLYFDGTNGFTIDPWTSYPNTQQLEGISDFNNDGYDDVLIRKMPGNDSLFVIYGGSSFDKFFRFRDPRTPIDGTNGMSIGGLTAGDQLNSVATLDFNNDGYDDVFVSSQTSNEIYGIYGNGDGAASSDINNLQTSRQFKITGFKANGLAVHKAGDINADGLDDIIVMDSVVVDGIDKIVMHYIPGQNVSNTVHTVTELQNSTGYDIVIEESINYINNPGTNQSLIYNPDFNGDGYEDFVLSYGGAPNLVVTKFLLSQVPCIPTSSVENVTVCSGEDYTCPDGTILANVTKSISYVSQLASKVNGCDSLVTTSIVVNQINTVVSTEGNTLTAEEVQADRYQWLDCDLDSSPIEGATNFVFSAPKSGNYALVIEKDGCSETSDCITLVITGIEDIGNMVQRIWPNPTSGELNIELAEDQGPVDMIICDVNGRILSQKKVDSNYKMLTTEIPGISGVYFIKVQSKAKAARFKVIKK